MKQMVLAFAVGLLASQVSAMQSLPDLEWKNRVILVFGSSADPRLDQQIGLLKGQEDELAEHDLVIIKVSDDDALDALTVATRGSAGQRLVLSVRKVDPAPINRDLTNRDCSLPPMGTALNVSTLRLERTRTVDPAVRVELSH